MLQTLPNSSQPFRPPRLSPRPRHSSSIPTTTFASWSTLLLPTGSMTRRLFITRADQLIGLRLLLSQGQLPGFCSSLRSRVGQRSPCDREGGHCQRRLGFALCRRWLLRYGHRRDRRTEEGRRCGSMSSAASPFDSLSSERSSSIRSRSSSLALPPAHDAMAADARLAGLLQQSSCCLRQSMRAKKNNIVVTRGTEELLHVLLPGVSLLARGALVQGDRFSHGCDASQFPEGAGGSERSERKDTGENQQVCS